VGNLEREKCENLQQQALSNGFDGAVGAPSWGWEKWKRAAAGMGWDPYFPDICCLIDFFFIAMVHLEILLIDLINHNSNLTTRLKTE
jgi:hypothetical protein